MVQQLNMYKSIHVHNLAYRVSVILDHKNTRVLSQQWSKTLEHYKHLQDFEPLLAPFPVVLSVAYTFSIVTENTNFSLSRKHLLHS